MIIQTTPVAIRDRPAPLSFILIPPLLIHITNLRLSDVKESNEHKKPFRNTHARELDP